MLIYICRIFYNNKSLLKFIIVVIVELFFLRVICRFISEVKISFDFQGDVLVSGGVVFFIIIIDIYSITIVIIILIDTTIVFFFIIKHRFEFFFLIYIIIII